MMAQLSEYVSVSEAVRLSGLSIRTLKRMAEEGRLKFSKSPGGHVRVARADVDHLLRHSANASPASSVLQNRKERIEELGLEAQERRAKREIRKLDEEEDEAERVRAEAQRAETLANKRALAELRLQQKRDTEERRREKLARQREDFRRRWMRWLSSGFPDWLSEYQAQILSAAAEKTLAGCDLREPDADVRRALEATIARIVAPWRAERESCAKLDRLIAEAVQWRLPFSGTTDADKARATSSARAALSEVPLGAGDVEVRAVVDAAVAEIAREIEDRTKGEQARALAERERQQREGHKSFLVSVGVACVSPYISKLHSGGELWDEDLSRTPELEVAVRKALEEKLTGGEHFEDAQRIARELVDSELA